MCKRPLRERIGLLFEHNYTDGLCPDPVEGYETRDPECPGCRNLMLLEYYPELVKFMEEKNDHGQG